jgi:hypothetical protein
MADGSDGRNDYRARTGLGGSKTELQPEEHHKNVVTPSSQLERATGDLTPLRLRTLRLPHVLRSTVLLFLRLPTHHLISGALLPPFSFSATAEVVRIACFVVIRRSFISSLKSFPSAGAYLLRPSSLWQKTC